jgi:hypothetical protein
LVLLGGALVPAARGRESRVAPRARVTGAFAMSGRITTAVNVRGERPGQAIRRRWTFAGSGCTKRYCRTLRLRRGRGGGRHSTVTLKRQSDGSYHGSSVYSAALSCLGRVFPHGETVPYSIDVRVSATATVQGRVFARRLSATYVNLDRIDHTPCPLGPSHDAARYVGTAAPLASPPQAGFAVRGRADSTDASFLGVSRRGAGGARIVGRRWNFGDPRSGRSDRSTRRRSRHAFSRPGTYSVTLTVIDANGLSSTLSKHVRIGIGRLVVKADRRQRR